MKAVKQTVRHYYKYVYEDWEQPIATSDTTSIDGGDMVFTRSSAYTSQQAYMAFDNNLSTCWATNAAATGWWQVKLPYKIIIKGLSFYQRSNAGSYRTNTARFYTGSDKATPIGNEFTGSTESYGETAIEGIPSEGIETDTIYLNVTNGKSSCGMGELKVTALIRTVVESTEDDYDYYKDEIVTLLPKEIVRHYWKKVSWTQPIATGEITILPEGNMVCSCSTENRGYTSVFGPLDGVKSGTDQSNIWMPNNQKQAWWMVKLPYKINITGLVHYNGYGSTSGDKSISGRYYADSNKITPIGDSISTADTNWLAVNISGIPSDGIETDTIYFDKTNGGNGYSGIGEIEITGYRVFESTEQDYDFYTDDTIYYGINE